MKSNRRISLLERTLVLMMLGLVMGTIGGAAVGLITGRTPSSASQ
jgi:hypothetical protein